MNKASNYKGQVQLVVFDWAGTTIDHGSCAPAGAFIEGFRRKGVEATVEQARGPMGMGKRDHIKVMSEMGPLAEQWRTVHGREVTEQDIDDMYEDFVPVLMDVLPDFCTLIPGAVDTLNTLREMGCKVGGTTGYFDEAMELCRDKAAEQGYSPDISLAATQVKMGRPAPWLIFEIMTQLDIFPPTAVVKVGDTIPDIEAGHNAGAWTVGIARTGNSVGLSKAELAALSGAEQEERIASAHEALGKANPHFIVDSIADVPAIIAEINERLKQGERP